MFFKNKSGIHLGVDCRNDFREITKHFALEKTEKTGKEIVERRFSFFIGNFEHILLFFLVFILLTFNK